MGEGALDRLAHQQRSYSPFYAQRTRGLSGLFALTLMLGGLIGCGVPKHPVEGRLGPFSIKTSVDAPIAQRYLTSTLEPEERALLS